MEVNNLNTNRRAQIGNITIPLLKGEQGYSISRIVRTSGDGGAGTTDTYTVYIDTDPETAIGTFQVVNGTGGDMSKSVYDIDNDDIVDRATGDGNGNEITATYETIENVTALASRVVTLEQAGYITKSVADLANYYLKSETYTKQEVNNLCDMIPKFAIEVVSVLPTQDISETTIYLLRDDEETQDVYQEYIYVNNTWERIGGQRIDLSNYYQKSETYSKEDLNGKLVNVGATAPENGERVWFKKSKNLFNINGGTAEGTQNVSIVIDGNTIKQTNQSNYARSAWEVQGLEINKQYTLSLNFTNTNASSLNARVYKSDGSTLIIQSNATTNTSGEIELTFTAIEDIVYIRLYSNTSQTGNTYEVDFSNIQLAPGSSASAFEPYVEEGIYVDEEEWYSKPKVLWTNPSPTSEFAGQTITLNDSIENYKYYEVMYRRTNSSSTIRNISSGKIPSGQGADLIFAYYYNFIRTIESVRGTSISFQNCNQYQTYGNSTITTANSYIIPYQILGYKE